MNLGTAQVIRADARHLPLADNSVDLVVTSPPYFALRSYQDGGEHYEGQIGSEPTPAEFVAALLEVTRECVRVLKPSGSLWVNLGDKYATGATPGPQSANTTMTGGTHKGVSNVVSRKVQDGVRTKSLIGIPWRYALACIDDLGLILRAEVIWSKPNGLPESVTDRVRRSHEQWFHFSLEPRYFSAVDEIREAHAEGAHGRRKDGQPSPKQAAGLENGTRRGYMAETYMNPLGKLPGSVWTVPTEPLRVPDHLGIDHFAAFPTEWPKRIIQGWSPAGVCVECGEGLRPVPEVLSVGGAAKRAYRHLPGYSDPAGVGRRDVTYRIEGYECACRQWTPQSIASARITASTTGSTPAQTAAVADSQQPPTQDATATGTGADASPRAATSTTGSTTSTRPTLRPAVVLDPFGGTGTTAMVAKALGRHGISVDMSADYCRLATWRTNDRDQLAKVLGIDKAGPVDEEQLDLFGEAAS